MGIYSDKSIRGIGKIENIVTADLLPTGELNVIETTRPITEKQKQNILEIIPFALENSGYHISTGHKFFCIEQFFETDFVKKTKYPLQGTKFFNLKTELNLSTLPPTRELADLLRDRTW